MEKKIITITAEIGVYFAPGDRVRLKHLPDIKGTVTEVTSWHGYNDVMLFHDRPPRLSVSHYEIRNDDGTSCFSSNPDDYELDV